MVESKENGKRMRLCPRFDTCSVPKCPLDELISFRAKLDEDPTCPYTTNRKDRRIRPITQQVKRFLKPNADGSYKSIFEKTPPERKN